MSETSEALFSLQEVRKSFGMHTGLKGVSLEISSGERVLLLGANGAGKSTLLRIATKLSRPSSGKVVFHDDSTVPRIGFTSHDHMLYEHLTVREQLELARSVSKRTSAPLDDEIRRWGLYDHADRQIGELSKGLQHRASLCRMFSLSPDYLFLDEPTSTLDDAAVQLLCSRLLEIVPGKLRSFAILATHDLTRLAHIATRLIVLDEGTVCADTREMGRIKRGASLEDLKQDAVKVYREMIH